MASILVIEDGMEIRQLVRDVLEREGHEVREALNGEEGVKSFEEARADLVITDLFMPRKGGIETIADLQEIDADVRIIAMTSHGGAENYDFLRVAQALGAKTLEKPFMIDALRKVVEEALSG
ncbi:MAG: response regulator [Candidatus Latescibacteria bacterium]|jgi:two-component system chemotaxis response regulator CheY|nr:response regulator [Candidatus Latescibacterota bacterium]